MSERQKATPEQQKAWIERHGITPPAGFHATPAPFEISSGAMRVTDPCYDMDTWCAGTLENVKNGIWLGTSYNQYDDWSWRWMMESMPLLGLKYDDTKPTDPKTVFAKVSELLTGLSEAEREAKLPELEAALSEFGIQQRVANLIVTLWDDTVPADKREAGISMWLRDEDVSFGMGDSRREYNDSLAGLKAGMVGTRAHWLTAIHEDYKDDPRFQPDQLFATLLTAERSEISVGVDSGQAGLFDNMQFARHPQDRDYANFYEIACNASYPDDMRRRDRGHVEVEGDRIQIPNSGPVQIPGKPTAMGYNASSGYGDGSYELRFVRDDAGQVIFANIMFIVPDELRSDEDADE